MPHRTLCPVMQTSTRDNLSFGFYSSGNRLPDTTVRLRLCQNGMVTSLSFDLFRGQVTTPGALITTSTRVLEVNTLSGAIEIRE